MSVQPQTIPQDQPKAPFPRRGKTRDRMQAIAIQRVLEQTILDPETPAQSRASCAAAWTRIQEAKRIIDGKPLPGQLRPDLEQRNKGKAFGRAKSSNTAHVLKLAQVQSKPSSTVVEPPLPSSSTTQQSMLNEPPAGA